MGSHSSKAEADRQPEGAGASGSHKLSKKHSKENLREQQDTDIVGRDANMDVQEREPLDKRDPWGHMAKVVHSRHGSGV
jgi:hypothetical protein